MPPSAVASVALSRRVTFAFANNVQVVVNSIVKLESFVNFLVTLINVVSYSEKWCNLLNDEDESCCENAKFLFSFQKNYHHPYQTNSN